MPQTSENYDERARNVYKALDDKLKDKPRVVGQSSFGKCTIVRTEREGKTKTTTWIQVDMWAEDKKSRTHILIDAIPLDEGIELSGAETLYSKDSEDDKIGSLDEQNRLDKNRVLALLEEVVSTFTSSSKV